MDNVRLTATADPALQAAPAGGHVRISYLAAAGYHYQLQSSDALQSWSPHGALVTGTDAEAATLFPTTGTPRKFFRVAVTPPP